jgi:beta-alanine--pyruvate transaminase
MGTPFAVDWFGIQPDMVTLAKGITSGVIPMGAVMATSAIHDTFMQGPPQAIEFAHGYTYSANPMACAAALGTLDTYDEEGLLTRGGELAGYWADAAHALKGLPHVIDIRTIGLMAAIELEPRAEKPTARAFEAYLKCYEAGLLVRTTGDIIALSPPLIIEKKQIDQLFDILAGVLKTIA